MPSSAKKRILFVATHPVQYAAPLFRRMAADARLEIHVAYLSLAGATPTHDAGFGATVQWDVPLLDGDAWTLLSEPQPAALRGIVAEGWDAVVLHTGYRYRVFWTAVRAARRRRIPVLFGTDAHGFTSQNGRAEILKGAIKRLVLPWLFRLADVAIVPSSRSRDFLVALRMPPERVVVTPYVVDNDWWREAASKVDREQVRQAWGIPCDATVFLYCAKLQPWKRPQDLLAAFARLGATSAHLVLAGEGPLRGELERAAESLGVAGRTRFLGFVNQGALPATYRASDVLVLPSAYEPFGVVVNEAMLCGCVPIVSDQVGAGGDLVTNEHVGFVHRVCAIDDLALAMKRASEASLEAMRSAGAERIAAWSPELNIERLIEAVERAAARRS
jgi:glycosyltransferase involved in cell wall biosynthesis